MVKLDVVHEKRRILATLHVSLAALTIQYNGTHLTVGFTLLPDEQH